MPKARSTPPTQVTHHPTISPELTLKRLERLVEQITRIRASGQDSAHSPWLKDVKIVLSEFYGEQSRIFREFDQIRFGPVFWSTGTPDSVFVDARNAGLDTAKTFLESRINDLRETAEQIIQPPEVPSFIAQNGRKIFVVHGHDHGVKETVARFLAKLELEPIILHEQANEGMTIIEKFESHAAGVQCAVVILTSDDVASSKEAPERKESRARQNVILELGFFVGRLGRERTFALVENGITLPSDIHGLIYIPLDDGEWRLRLVKELKAAGLDVDANQAF